MSLETGQGTAVAAGPDMADMDSPLVGDAAGLRASWQRVQAGFVDNPRDAVADAAALVEHAAQVLVGTLRQRQQQLRGMWDTTIAQGAGGAGAAGTGAAADVTRAADAPRADLPRPTFIPATAPEARPADDATTGRGAASVSDTVDDSAAAGHDATDGMMADDGVRMADSGATTADNGAAEGARAAGAGMTANGAGPAAGEVADTEQLRILMQRYRVLLSQICPSL